MHPEAPRLPPSRSAVPSLPNRPFARRRRHPTPPISTPSQAYILPSQPAGVSESGPTGQTFLPIVGHRSVERRQIKQIARTIGSQGNDSASDQSYEPGYFIEISRSRQKTPAASAKRASALTEGSDDVEFVAVNRPANSTGCTGGNVNDTMKVGTAESVRDPAVIKHVEEQVRNGEDVDMPAGSDGLKRTVGDDDDRSGVRAGKAVRVRSEELLAKKFGYSKEEMDSMLTYVPLHGEQEYKEMELEEVEGQTKTTAGRPLVLSRERKRAASDAPDSKPMTGSPGVVKRAPEVFLEGPALKRSRVMRSGPTDEGMSGSSPVVVANDKFAQPQHAVLITDTRPRNEKRRKSSAHAASGNGARTRVRRKLCFLDGLPEEVCTRIATYSGRFPDLNALCLAQTSKSFTEAVLSCVEHRLDLTTPEEVPHLQQWEKVFLPCVRDIRCSDPAWPLDRKLLQSTTLMHVTIPYDEGMLSELRMAPNLRSLSVLLDGVYSPRALITAIAQLKVDHLSICCQFCDTDVCAITKLGLSRRGRRGFANFPAIKSVEFSCDRKSTDVRTDLEYTTLVTALPNLHEITLNCPVPESAIEALARLGSVRLIGVTDGVQTAVKIGSSVTALMCSVGQTFVRGEDIARLAACPNLKELALSVEPGAEIELPPVIRKLKVLHLSWRWERVRQSNNSCKAKYYKPPADVIWAIVQSAPDLTELVLHGAPLFTSQVTRILSRLGPQLLRFGLTVDTAGETTHEFLLVLMNELRLKCPRLAQLDLKFNNNFGSLPEEAGLRWSRKLQLGLKMLERRLPLLNVWDLEQGIRRLDTTCIATGV